MEDKVLDRMKNSMHMFNKDSNEETAKELFNSFFEFGCMEDVELEKLQSFTLKSENMIYAHEILADLATYFHILMSDLNRVYDDDGQKEYNLYKLCCIRSGLETFIELFEARLKDNYELGSYDDWYNVTLNLPEFDKKLEAKLREFPILRWRYIPKDITVTHWWFQHPTEW